MYKEIQQEKDLLLKEAERVLDHAKRTLPTGEEIEKEMEKFSEPDKADIKKYAISLEKALEQDQEKRVPVKSGPKIFKTKYKRI